MYYIDDTHPDEIQCMISNIEKYLCENDYENAFIIFLLYLSRLNSNDRDEMLLYFKFYFQQKMRKDSE